MDTNSVQFHSLPLSKKVEILINNSEYERASDFFLESTKSQILFNNQRIKKHFDDDKEQRLVFNVTIKRGTRKFSFDFGTSINDTIKAIVLIANRPNRNNKFSSVAQALNVYTTESIFFKQKLETALTENTIQKPSSYDVLACLQKYEVGTFEDFCSNFGYEEDSRKSENIYKAVLKEYDNLCKLFSDEELEVMQFIS